MESTLDEAGEPWFLVVQVSEQRSMHCRPRAHAAAARSATQQSQRGMPKRSACAAAQAHLKPVPGPCSSAPVEPIRRSVCVASVAQGRYEWPDLAAASCSVCSSASAARLGRSAGEPSAAARPSASRQPPPGASASAEYLRQPSAPHCSEVDSLSCITGGAPATACALCRAPAYARHVNGRRVPAAAEPAAPRHGFLELLVT